MDLTYSAEEREFRERARDWLQANVPREKRPPPGPQARAFDLAWQRQQFDGGWAGVSWPASAQGLGLSLIHQLIWHEEYARADAPPPGSLFIALNHAGPTLMLRGTAAQQAFHLPKILRGEVVWCQGFSEPGAGSDLAGVSTRGVVDGDHLVVNGQKIWTSYGHVADYQELLVRTGPPGGRHAGLTWVIGDMHLPGITIVPLRTMTGDQYFCQVFYDNVRIPLSNVVSAVDDGWSVAMSTLSVERGTAMIPHQMELANKVEHLFALARELPAPGGHGCAFDDGQLRARLVTARAEVAALRAMTYASISRGQRQPVPGPEGAMVALYCCELLKRVETLAMDMLGPVALEYEGATRPWLWGYLDSYKYTIAGGTSEIRRNIIGERVLGLPR